MDDQQPEDKMDLSMLMPSPARLEAMAQAVATRLRTRRVRLRDALPRQLLRWAGPSLAVSAGLALSLWMVGVKPEPTDSTTAFTQWALSGEEPTAKSILETFDNGEEGQP